MSNQLTLYPKIHPYDSGFLDIDNHNIYYEQCGNHQSQKDFGVGVRKDIQRHIILAIWKGDDYD